MNNLMHQHGGDLDAIEKLYGIPKDEIWDFSGNINPLGFPESVKKAIAQNVDIVTKYPDKRYTALKESIGIYTGANPKHIVVGNGSTELISTFIKTANARETIIIGPAYSEYEREASICGSDFRYFPLKEEENFEINITNLINELTEKVGMLIICNPNNPTGTAITTIQMRKILSHCKKNNTFVMVDETYIEFSDNIDEICTIPLVEEFNNVFVIRGISKFFAAPGIRLGYGICSNEKFLNTLISVQDPWSVNVFAAFAGERLFKDTEFISKSKKLISDERKKAFAELSNWKNIKSYNSCSNFILLKLMTDKINSAEIFDILIKQKMLIRDAESFTFLDNSYLRFCILNPEQNEKLLSELKKIVE